MRRRVTRMLVPVVLFWALPALAFHDPDDRLRGHEAGLVVGLDHPESPPEGTFVPFTPLERDERLRGYEAGFVMGLDGGIETFELVSTPETTKEGNYIASNPDSVEEIESSGMRG